MAVQEAGEGRVRVGVVGVGSIAQIIHLPYLRDLSDRFVVSSICDIARDTLEFVGELYGVPEYARFADWRELCSSELVDAVLICPNGSHVPQAVAALRAGKHVLVEKPLAYRLDEANEFVEAATAARRRTGSVTLLGYMKRFDPGYQYGQHVVRPLAQEGRIRFVDARHIHTNNEHYMAHHPVFRGTDIEPGVQEKAARETASDQHASLGPDAPPAQARAFLGMMGSSIHDVYTLNGLLGRPQEILASEAWDGGRCWSAIFRYPNGALVNYAWIDIRDVREFKQEFACYADDSRVTITFGSPFLTSAATTVRVQGMEQRQAGAPFERAVDEAGWDDVGPAHWERRVSASYVNQYKREWLHFYSCIREGVEPLITPQEARDDVAFVIDWARATRTN